MFVFYTSVVFGKNCVLTLSALEKDDYSHVTATYYLLAERVLRAEREARARTLLNDAMAKSNPELASIDMIEDDADR